MLNSNILRTSRAIRISSFKGKKQKKLIALSNTTQNKINAYDVPVINLSSIQLTDKELNQLSFGLDHSYVDKNKHVKNNLAANFESLAQAVDSETLNQEKEVQTNQPNSMGLQKHINMKTLMESTYNI